MNAPHICIRRVYAYDARSNWFRIFWKFLPYTTFLPLTTSTMYIVLYIYNHIHIYLYTHNNTWIYLLCKFTRNVTAHTAHQLLYHPYIYEEQLINNWTFNPLMRPSMYTRVCVCVGIVLCAPKNKVLYSLKMNWPTAHRHRRIVFISI